MRVAFVFDTRFRKHKDNYYSVSLSSQLLTERYLSVFDEMLLVGRYKEVQESPSGKLQQCNGDRIQFCGVKDRSPIKRLLHFSEDSQKIRETLKTCDAVICRGWRGTSICRKLGKPYVVEVVNCAWDSYWNHGFLGKMVAPIMYFCSRRSIKKAPYTVYVTNAFLQKRYPTKGRTACISNVALQAYSDHVLQERLQRIERDTQKQKIVIGTAAAVDVPFKGQRYVIRALAALKKQGKTNYEYQLAGGGDNTKLKSLAEKLGVSDQVVFKGSIVHDEMFAWFDSLDMYIQPSLQEGLPRALIEAMSRGLPCYGTRTGGIPELLDPSCVCKRNVAISKKFVNFLNGHTQEKALAMAKMNYEESKKYAADVLRDRRYRFFKDFADEITGGIHEEVKFSEN